MDKKQREVLEYKSLYADERYAKKAFKQLIGVSLEDSASKLPETIDPKTGERSFQSALDEMAYNNVKARLQRLGLDREPQQAEMIIECNILRARFNDSTFNVIMDRTAGKVKDELAIHENEFEHLTDEELELLAKFRDEQKNKKEV